MAFDPTRYDIQIWLDQETRRTLQKICNILDADGRLVEEYKTRVDILPKDSIDPKTGNNNPAYGPALYRTYTWDDDGNVVSSVPVMREWTQFCEDNKEGLLISPTLIDNPGGTEIPPQAKYVEAIYTDGDHTITYNYYESSSKVTLYKTIVTSYSTAQDTSFTSAEWV